MTHALAPYPDPESRDTTTRGLADALGGEAITYGQSVEGRPLLAVRVPARVAGAPRVLVTGNIHGVEWISSQVALGVLRVLGTPAGAPLRANAEVWVIPCLNPDGYARTFLSGGHGSLAGLRTNANGVDLNRNFPLPAGHVRKRLPGAGSSTPGKATYVGTGPLSEPESEALDRLLHDQQFHAGINGHSFMGKVIPARALRAKEASVYKGLARALAKAQGAFRYGRLASNWIDTFTGELEDHQHHHHRMWAACLETFTFGASVRQHLRAPSLFWRFNPHDVQRWCNNDVPAVAAFLLAALKQPRPAG
ncbi:MAG: M14 family metallopeptidase [Deltaproteobacteria bacterium]|nr:M14 family metallopeptidase [Deltaproteobacteria bacterium]